jgi:O-antigen/teichoic acid export membrane protein/glycosyltransferase involved in cell wall biosynthesis
MSDARKDDAAQARKDARAPDENDHVGLITRGVLSNWAWYALVIVSGLIAPRVIGDLRGRELLGVWDFAWSLTVWVQLLALGLADAIARYVARYRAQRAWSDLSDAVNAALFWMSGALLAGIALTVGLALWTPHLLPDANAESLTVARRVVLLLGIGAGLQILFAPFNSIITGYARFDLLNLIRGARDGATLVLLVSLLLAGYGLVAVSLAVLIIEVASDCVKVIVARRLCPHLHLAPWRLKLHVLKDLLIFGSKSIVQGLSRAALYQANSIIVAYYLGPATLAVYARQRALVMHALRFVKQYAQVFLPSSSFLEARGERAALRQLLILSSKYGMYVTAPITVILLLMGGPLLRVWMGPEYEAPTVLAILAIGHVLALSQMGAYSILAGLGRHGLPAVLNAFGAGVSVVMGLLLLGPWKGGMLAAAVAVAAPTTLTNGLLIPLIACLVLDVPLARYTREFLAGPILACIPLAVILATSRWLFPGAPWQAVLIGLGGGGAVTACIYWAFVLPEQIRGEITRRIGRRLSRHQSMEHANVSAETANPTGNQTRPASRPRLCFVAPGAYGAVSGRQDLSVGGGAEVQQVLIARGLARRGFQVSFITLDHGQPDGICHDGIRTYKMCAWDAGWPGLRFLYPRWTSLWSALGRAQADVYFQRKAGTETGQVALWCRRHRRPFVFAAASDVDCQRSLEYLSGARERWLYRYGLQRASRVVTQTRTQRQLLKASYGLDALLITSCKEDPLEGSVNATHAAASDPPMLLWVGRSSPQKRPDMLLELARKCPEYVIHAVGAASPSNERAKRFLQAAADLPNLAAHEWVPYEKMAQFYQRASLLICTSLVEGFPNTFMEAWARGIPVVSTVDPDGVIAAHGLGMVGDSPADLRDGIERLLSSPDQWHECSERSRRFYLEMHTVDRAVDAYERLFNELFAEYCDGAFAEPPAPALRSH